MYYFLYSLPLIITYYCYLINNCFETKKITVRYHQFELNIDFEISRADCMCDGTLPIVELQ